MFLNPSPPFSSFLNFRQTAQGAPERISLFCWFPYPGNTLCFLALLAAWPTSWPVSCPWHTTRGQRVTNLTLVCIFFFPGHCGQEGEGREEEERGRRYRMAHRHPIVNAVVSCCLDPPSESWCSLSQPLSVGSWWFTAECFPENYLWLKETVLSNAMPLSWDNMSPMTGSKAWSLGLKLKQLWKFIPAAEIL